MILQSSEIYNECKNDPVFAFNIRAVFSLYQKGDFGCLCEDDKQINQNITAAYNVGTSHAEIKKVYILADQTTTAVVFAENIPNEIEEGKHDVR